MGFCVPSWSFSASEAMTKQRVVLPLAIATLLCCTLFGAGLSAFVLGARSLQTNLVSSIVTRHAALEEVVKGARVSITYKIVLEDSLKVVDSTEGKPPLAFVVGEGTMMQQMEEGVLGMKVNETKVLKFDTDAPLFGKRNEELVMEYARSRMPDNVKVGQPLTIKEGTPPVWVTALGETTATLDANNPLAGKAAMISLQVVSCEEVG